MLLYIIHLIISSWFSTCSWTLRRNFHGPEVLGSQPSVATKRLEESREIPAVYVRSHRHARVRQP
jgi:hypothetical protein